MWANLAIVIVLIIATYYEGYTIMELKKLFASIVLACGIALASGSIAGIIYNPELNPEKRGYSIEVAKAPEATPIEASKLIEKSMEVAAETPAVAEIEVAAATPAAPVDLATLLKTADIKAGKKISKKCKACHDLSKGGKNKVGPALYGVVGRAVASKADFKYSKAMKAKGGKWTNEKINEFITKPKKYIKGTKMAFAGLKKAEQRANLIAYLNTLK